MIKEQQLEGIEDYIYFNEVHPELTAYLLGQTDLVAAETTDWSPYDKYFRWLRTEITGIAGIPNHGKSKFVVFLSALKMFYSNWKVSVYSPETSPPTFFYSSYLHTLTGKGLFSKIQKPSVDEIRKFKKILNDNLFLFVPDHIPTFKGILEKFRKAYEYHNCDMFIIDPFNCLDREWEKSKRDDLYVGECLDQFKEFAKSTKSCGIVVMHPNASIRTKKDGYDHECPGIYSLAGGAMWSNKLDNLIFVHRPKYTTDYLDSTVLLRHAKIKKREIVGMGGDVYPDFNFVTNRYRLDGIEPDFNNIYPEPNEQ